MKIKTQLGKLTLRLPLADLIREQQETNGFHILPVTLPHILELESLPLHHKDPFDRLLVAQANAEGVSLLSADPIFKNYTVNLLT